MLISRRRARTAFLLPAVWLMFAALAAPAAGQVPSPEPERLPPPEQIIDEALKKIDEGQLQDADALLRRARVLKPTMDKIKLVEGLLALGAKDSIGALGRLQEYNKTQEGRNDYRGFLAVGRIYKDSQMPRMAFPHLEKAKLLAPEVEKESGKRVEAEIAIELAIVYNAVPMKDKALEAAKEAKELAQDDARVQLSYGRIAFGMDKFSEAAQSADRAIELLVAAQRADPLKRDTYQQLNACYYLRRDLALRESKDAPDGAPYFRLAVAALNLAEVNRLAILLDGRESIVQALVKEPENIEYLLLVARFEAELGAVDEAQARLDRILKGDPENREALALREQLKPGAGGFTPQ